MKKTFLFALTIIFTGLLISCDESFLERQPVGVFGDALLASELGVEKSLIGAYSYLNGPGMGIWTAGLPADVTGSIQGGEYTKGSSSFDYLVVNESVAHDHTTGSGVASGNFTTAYTGIDRCNTVIKLANATTDMTEADKEQAIAEARFLRGIWYFHLEKCFGNIPYIDETTEDARVPNYEGDASAENYTDNWPYIIADFEYAMNKLPDTQVDEPARPNKWAAQCMLAKVMVYAATYDATTYSSYLSTALTYLNEAIASGVTSSGDAYELIENYHDNFDAAYEHNAEYVWGIELSTLDGDASGAYASPNANQGAQFWGLWADANGPDKAQGWGFMQPTEWWANHFRTDANGLPYLDMFEGDWSSTDTLKDDWGLSPDPAVFEIDTQGVDPRLDWNIGRRGVDYLGWGNFPGSSWIRLQSESSPYENKKSHVWKDQVGVYQSTNNPYPSINVPILRFAEVLLLAAECEVRTGGSLSNARDHVNEVRQRMMNNSSSGRHWVKVGGRSGTVDAANYRIGLYPSDGSEYDAFASTTRALDAILYERTLELGAEGHRFFDVVRFGKGLEEFNDYLEFEKSLGRYGHYGSNYSYEEPKDMYMPIPTSAIDRSIKDGVATLLQNPDY